MAIAVLSGILVLVVGGCVCVVWAARGGPRWVRGVSRATLFAGEAVRKAEWGRKSTSSDDGS